jgi:hypothetical protein
VEPELAPDLLDVAFRRAFRDEKPGRDLAVRQPLTNEDGHLSLAAGEIGRDHRDRAGA